MVNECKADQVDIRSLQWILEGKLQTLFKEVNCNDMWEFWRFGKSSKLPYNFYEKAQQITDVDKLPTQLPVFVQQFQTVLNQAGFNSELVKNLPAPSHQKGKGDSTPQTQLQNVLPQEGENTISQTSSQHRMGLLKTFLRKLFQ